MKRCLNRLFFDRLALPRMSINFWIYFRCILITFLELRRMFLESFLSPSRTKFRGAPSLVRTKHHILNIFMFHYKIEFTVVEISLCSLVGVLSLVHVFMCARGGERLVVETKTAKPQVGTFFGAGRTFISCQSWIKVWKQWFYTNGQTSWTLSRIIWVKIKVR